MGHTIYRQRFSAAVVITNHLSNEEKTFAFASRNVISSTIDLKTWGNLLHLTHFRSLAIRLFFSA
jgi:hypothetical protein